MTCYQQEWYRRLAKACQPDQPPQSVYDTQDLFMTDVRAAMKEVRHMQAAVEMADRRIIQTKNEVRSATDEMMQACHEACKRWQIVQHGSDKVL